ncbi:Os08g0326900 [Oryza sativa Japonica Group]|uniref:Os08g0326900 protein n=1 Tax=Oryza sativa subsp. japonica TaxID=39947 RepID=Q0J6E7_ORYSJ|nr:Os08g0326900 [Oryza sativa Japonica Group]|eukprot:NP_001061554.1 Os08g0326900 [Oryza sativa Japonica Group]
MAWSARARRGATGSRRRLGARKEEEAAALGTNPLLSFPLDAGGGRGADGRGGTDSTSRSPPRSEKGASRQWRQRRRSPRPRAAAPDRGGEPSVRGGCWRRRRHLRVAPDFFFVP